MSLLSPPSMPTRWSCFEEQLPIPDEWETIIWPHNGNWYDHPRHQHQALELNIVVSGRGHYEVDGRIYPLYPGSVLWLHPGRQHHLGERSEDFFMWIVAVSPRLLERSCGGWDHPRVSEASVQCQQLGADDFAWLEREVRRLDAAPSVEFRKAGVGYVVLAAWEASQNAAARPSTCGLSRGVYRALTLLESDLTLSQGKISEAIGANPDVLSRQFRRELGVSLLEFRNRRRLHRFLEIARRPDVSLLAACLEAGFGSYAQFHRVFMAEMERSPRAFLEGMRGTQCQVPARLAPLSRQVAHTTRGSMGV